MEHKSYPIDEFDELDCVCIKNKKLITCIQTGKIRHMKELGKFTKSVKGTIKGCLARGEK